MTKKENTNVAVKETKKVATKAKAVKKVETKPAAVKTEKVEEVKNEVKKNNTLNLVTIQEVTEMYKDAGIKCHNPEGKGNYRIMGGMKGSSLNVKGRLGYFIYSTEDDFKLMQDAKLVADDLVLEQGTNAQDKVRPNTVICTTTETLKKVLAVFANNPANQIVVIEPAK